MTSIDPEVFSHCPSVDTLVADPDSAAYQLLSESDSNTVFNDMIRIEPSDSSANGKDDPFFDEQSNMVKFVKDYEALDREKESSFLFTSERQAFGIGSFASYYADCFPIWFSTVSISPPSDAWVSNIGWYVNDHRCFGSRNDGFTINPSGHSLWWNNSDNHLWWNFGLSLAATSGDITEENSRDVRLVIVNDTLYVCGGRSFWANGTSVLLSANTCLFKVDAESVSHGNLASRFSTSRLDTTEDIIEFPLALPNEGYVVKQWTMTVQPVAETHQLGAIDESQTRVIDATMVDDINSPAISLAELDLEYSPTNIYTFTAEFAPAAVIWDAGSYGGVFDGIDSSALPFGSQVDESHTLLTTQGDLHENKIIIDVPSFDLAVPEGFTFKGWATQKGTDELGNRSFNTTYRRWSDNEEQSFACVDDGYVGYGSNPNDKIIVEPSTTFYAVFEANIEFDSSKYGNGDTMTMENARWGDKVRAPDVAGDDGWTFRGWCREDNGILGDREDSDGIVAPTSTEPYYAVWGVDVEWMDGDTVVASEGDVLYGTQPAASWPEVAATEGYFLAGWEAAGGRYRLTDPVPSVTAPITFTTVWSAGKSTVTFDPDMDGLTSETLELTFDDEPRNLVGTDVWFDDRDGHNDYNFAGYYFYDEAAKKWVKYYNANGTAAAPKWDIVGDVTLKGRWTYDVYFDTNTTDPASVIYGSATVYINEAVPLSAGTSVSYDKFESTDAYGNQYYSGWEGDRERAKVTAWKGAPITLPVAMKRSGYDATQDWGTSADTAYGSDGHIKYATTGVTTSALAPGSVTPVNGAATLYAIWDVNPNGSEGHAKTYFVKLVDQTKYEQGDDALDAKDVVGASPAVLRAKFDAPLISAVNATTAVKAPTAADGLVFDGYYTSLDDNGVASGTQLTGGADETTGNVVAGGSVWRIAEDATSSTGYRDLVSDQEVKVESVTYDGKSVPAVVLYAKWSLPFRDIQFVANLDGLDDPAPIIHKQVNVDPLPDSLAATHVLADPAGNYVFAGWWDEPVYGSRFYDENGAIVKTGTTWPYHSAARKLYAHWTYELALDENLGAAHAGTDTVELSDANSIVNDKGERKTFTESVTDHALVTTLTKGEKVALYDSAIQSTPEKVAALAARYRTADDEKVETGYSFRGYFATDGWSNTSFSYAGLFDYSSLNTGGRATVYMGWEAMPTALTYVETWKDGDTTLDPSKLSSEGGRVGDHAGNTSVVYDAMLSSRSDEQLPYIPGWKFKGYFVHRDGGEEVCYMDEYGAPSLAWEEAGEAATLYAHYEQKRFTVDTDLHGGQGANPSFTNVVYNQALGAGPYLPTRTGYDFLGWYYCEKAVDETNPVFPCDACVKFYDENGYSTGKTWNIDGDGTLHAAWAPKTYTVNWNYNYTGAKEPFAQTTNQAYDFAIALPSAPKRPGYSFTGWSTEPDGTSDDAADVTSASVLGDEGHPAPVTGTTILYYAQWGDPQDYRIVLDAGVGGWFTETDSRTYAIEGKGATTKTYDISLDTDKETPLVTNVSERLSDYDAFEFLGWKEDLSGKDESFEAIPEEALRANTIPKDIGGVHALIAQWKVNLKTVNFYAYDPDMAHGSNELNDRKREEAKLYASTSATKPIAGSETSWYYGASPYEGDGTKPVAGANISCTQATAFPQARLAGYEFLGWYERGGDPEDASLALNCDPAAPHKAPVTEYVAAYAPIRYTFHFYVSEGEQEEKTITAAYDTEITLPGTAARNSLTQVTADEEANTLTSTDSYVYQGWWDVGLHESDLAYDEQFGWVPGAEVSVNDIVGAPGVRLYAPEGTGEPTHLDLYAQHRHRYSFTVPLRASIMVAVDDPEAPIQVFCGNITANTETGLTYRVEAIVADPIEGEGNVANANPGTEYVFTDESGNAQSANARLTLRNAGIDAAEALSVPLHETSIRYAKDETSLAGFTFKKGEPLQLEYGLQFPEGMTAVDFKSHLPKEGNTNVSYPIARLYYTIGFAPTK